MLSKAYIEDYHYIKLLIHEDDMTCIDLDNIVVTSHQHSLKLSVFKIEQFGEFFHINTTFKGRINLHQDYYVKLVDGRLIHLDLGQIMRTKRFDVENAYDGPLGVEYHLDKTIFRIWSPVAKEIKLVLNGNDVYPLRYVSKGLWVCQVFGDLDSCKYHYEVRVNEEFVKTLDPYAVASCANSESNYVIDFQKTYQLRYPSTKYNSYLESVIYELHLKDVNDLKQSSSYLALIDKLQYFKDLGITHLQVMPLNAFGGVDEVNKDALYNWGYNPVEFNVPTGWYASNPDDPYNRINELKMMIDQIHQKGLNINLDVVYNHVYDNLSFSLNNLVPGYVFRTDKQGFLTNGSGCGCDFASERYMNRKFMIDSLIHWVKNYQIDGFRFDLMGLIDYETLIEVQKQLSFIQSNIMLYGEGWNLPTSLPSDLRATLNNNWALPEFAFFNDYFRNVMRGEPYSDHGYLYNQNRYLNDVSFVLKGSSSMETFLIKPSQSINYVECHDNLTFVDKLKRDKTSISNLNAYLVLSLGAVVLSLGIPFIHAGEELGRTKKGIDNSYNLGLDINGISYQNQEAYTDVIKALKYFIDFRKNNALYQENDPDVIDQTMKVKFTDNNTVCYQTDGFQVILKNNEIPEEFNFDQDMWLLFEGDYETKEEVKSLLASQIGVYILKKKGSLC